LREVKLSSLPLSVQFSISGHDRLDRLAPQPRRSDAQRSRHDRLHWKMRVIWLMLRGECFRVPIYEDPQIVPLAHRMGEGSGVRAFFPSALGAMSIVIRCESNPRSPRISHDLPLSITFHHFSITFSSLCTALYQFIPLCTSFSSLRTVAYRYGLMLSKKRWQRQPRSMKASLHPPVRCSEFKVPCSMFVHQFPWSRSSSPWSHRRFVALDIRLWTLDIRLWTQTSGAIRSYPELSGANRSKLFFFSPRLQPSS
jgi:hypothetical protein